MARKRPKPRLMERLAAVEASSQSLGWLWLDPLSSILTRDDPGYAAALQLRSQHAHAFSRLDGLLPSLGFVVALLMMRLVYNNAWKALNGAQRARYDMLLRAELPLLPDRAWPAPRRARLQQRQLFP